MNHVSVKLPAQLDETIEDEAKRVGLNKSEKIRNDLLEIYDEELER